MLGRASRDADGSVRPPLLHTIATMNEMWIALVLLGCCRRGLVRIFLLKAAVSSWQQRTLMPNGELEAFK